MIDDEVVMELDRNPLAVTWVFFAAFWLAAGILFNFPRTLGSFLLALGITMLAPWWWLTRHERVVVDCKRKEARFYFSRFHPFRDYEVVPLHAFTRVYAAPLAREAGWSIHLSGRQGQHLRLGVVACPFEVARHHPDVLGLCESLAQGLGITNGGDGWRRQPQLPPMNLR